MNGNSNNHDSAFNNPSNRTQSKRPSNLKRVFSSKNEYRKVGNPQINHAPTPNAQPKQSDSFERKSDHLVKRDKIRSEDSESLVVNSSFDPLQKFSKNFAQTNGKADNGPADAMEGGLDDAIKEETQESVQEEPEVDSKLVIEYQNSLQSKPMPAIKMTLRIFETLPKSFYKKYDCVKEIGKGAYGTVFKGINNLTKQFVAIKRIGLRNKVEDFNELKVLMGASHPHIVTPIEYCVYDHHLYIVSEFCEGGSLFHRVIRKKKLDTEVGRRIMSAMLSALNYCHNIKNIVHRDIKPENMVFGSADSEDDIRLIDFGLSTMIAREEHLHKKCGSAFYLAPEVLKGQYDAKCDIWSLGVVLFVLLTGRPLIFGRGQKQVLAKVYALKSVDKMVQSALGSRDPKLIDFILKMLVVDPKERWGAKKLLSHPWLAGRPASAGTNPEGLGKTIGERSETNRRPFGKAAAFAIDSEGSSKLQLILLLAEFALLLHLACAHDQGRKPQAESDLQRFGRRR